MTTQGGQTRQSTPIWLIYWIVKAQPNRFTNHVRIRDAVQNISQTWAGSTTWTTQNFNPTIIALSYWSQNQYLLVSRTVTDGYYHESMICEANTCFNEFASAKSEGDRLCTAEDLTSIVERCGIRCAHEPLVRLPPTPAEQCHGTWRGLTDIPGFHDLRAFWSGKGEPLDDCQLCFSVYLFWIMDYRYTYCLRASHEPSPILARAGLFECSTYCV